MSDTHSNNLVIEPQRKTTVLKRLTSKLTKRSSEGNFTEGGGVNLPPLPVPSIPTTFHAPSSNGTTTLTTGTTTTSGGGKSGNSRTAASLIDLDVTTERHYFKEIVVMNMSSLTKAVYENNLEGLTKLVNSHKRDINKLDKTYGVSALYLAVALDRREMVKFLLTTSALRVNMAKMTHASPTSTTTPSTPMTPSGTPSSGTVNGMATNIIVNVEIGCPALKRTPLMIACLMGHFELVKTLLQHNANMYAVDVFGCTCFHYSLFNVNNDIFNHLLTTSAASTNGKHEVIPLENMNDLTGKSLCIMLHV